MGTWPKHNTKNCPNTRQQARLAYRKHKIKRNHQLVRKTSGTQGIAGMLPPVSQASVARDKSKWAQTKEIDRPV